MKLSPRKLLNDQCVANLETRPKDYSVFDARVRQLAVRVQPNGAKSWVLRGRCRDQQIRVTLGPVAGITVEQARELARKALNANLRTRDPNAQTLTFKDFEAIYSERKVKTWKESGRKTYRSQFNARILPFFRDKPIGLIEHRDVMYWFLKYSRKYPGGANRGLEIIKAILNAAIAWGYLGEHHPNPCCGIKKNHRPPRGRIVNTEGITRLGAVLEKVALSKPDVADVIRLLILTGCRHNEIVSLSWKEVGSDRLNLIDSKTGPKTVLIGTAARAILSKRKEQSRSPFVFPSSTNANRPRDHVRRQWRPIRTAAKLEADVRIHDLRHTFASVSIGSGESLYLTGALLGHRSTESTARYAHLQDAQLLSAAERVAVKIEGWLEGRPARIPVREQGPARQATIADLLAQLAQRPPHLDDWLDEALKNPSKVPVSNLDCMRSVI